ncbi:MAG: PASTA domain-containing protein [Nocardioides sp.]
MEHDALVGRVLDGRYRIGARVARGGMASVYEALDLRLDRTVAVKVMHAGLGDSASDHEFAERFVREARSAARLSHPNVVSVYDQGDDDGTVFLAMELVTGHTLRDTIVKESPMSPSRALALMEPVLSALAAAHRSGLIHRDIKPENVLIADDGRVKVADFGLAKAVSADTQHTATQGVLIGTVSYLAPELVVDGRADARADVYAAGVVLYELLTGVKPHEGETPIQVAYKHVHQDVPPPSERVPEIPPYVDALVARATARDRGLRPADASVMLHQLHRVSHALNDGVRDDPELTQDLAPMMATGVLDLEEVRQYLDPDLTQPVILTPVPMTVREPTTTLDRPPAAPRADPVLAPTPRQPRPGKASRPRRRRRGLVLLVLALVLALGIGGGAFWYGWARYDSAPGVAGLTQAQAEQALAGAELEFVYTDPVYNSAIPAGSVVDADPGKGAQVLPGDTVTLTLSLGKLRVPAVRGLTEDDAQDALMARQLDFGDSIPRFSETAPVGTILASRPKQGTELKPGDVVDLVISNGRKPVQLESWVGKQIDRARRVLEKRGLVVIVDDEQFNDTVPKGGVISQNPSSGTLFRRDEVHMTVSLGVEMIEVPSVRATGVQAAEDKLRALGFDVDVVQDDVYYGIGFATRTDPPSGSMAPRGSTITLYVV